MVVWWLVLGGRECGASPLEAQEEYLSLWGPADSARVPHLPVFDELGVRLQTGEVRQIFIQKQGSHSGHQGRVCHPRTPSFKCTEHCWKEPWFVIKKKIHLFVLYESKKGPQTFFFVCLFLGAEKHFLRKSMKQKQQQQFSNWGSSNIFPPPQSSQWNTHTD